MPATAESVLSADRDTLQVEMLIKKKAATAEALGFNDAPACGGDPRVSDHLRTPRQLLESSVPRVDEPAATS